LSTSVIFIKNAQSKQSPNRRKFTQFGHPAYKYNFAINIKNTLLKTIIYASSEQSLLIMMIKYKYRTEFISRFESDKKQKCNYYYN
jgi:hypothetical protein